MSDHRLPRYRMSVRQALVREDGSLDWATAPEVDFVAGVERPTGQTPMELSCRETARRKCRQAAANAPGELFGAFVCPNASPLHIEPEPFFTARAQIEEWERAA